MAEIQKFFKMQKKKPYVIAEVAQNHDGSLGQAHAYIDAVAMTGADAIKFQTHIAEEESTYDEPFRIKFSYEDNTRYDYWKRMEFTAEQWEGLYNHAKQVGLEFLSSPFSVKAFEMLDRIGVSAWKLGSGEVFNDVLLDKMIMTGKPILLSSGLSTFGDIEEQIKKVKINGNNIAVFQCTTSYPCEAEKIGLSIIPELKMRFNCCVGLSDHSGTIYPSIAAVALGAEILEVHVTMSKQMFGPDVSSSVTVEELAQIVNGTKMVHTAINSSIDKQFLNNEQRELKRIFSKSIYLKRDKLQGEIISEKDIAIKKPFVEIGIDSYYDILGKKLKTSKKAGQALLWKELE